MVLGVIDIGSNAARLFVCSFYNRQSIDKFKIIEFIRVPIRLGDFVFIDNEIPKKKQKDLLLMMQAFANLMKLYRVEAFEAVATSAFREAKNGPDLVDQIFKQTGIYINVIDGKKEANYIWNANVKLTDVTKNVLFVDVGGGSTEISLGINGEKKYAKSFPLGTVRILDNQDDEKVWLQMKNWLHKYIIPYQPEFILGTGGNINKLFDLMKVKPLKLVDYKSVKEWFQYINSLSLKERIAILGLNTDRADVISPAIAIYLTIMKHSNINHITISGIGLKEGVMQDLVLKHKKQIEKNLFYNI